MNTPSSYLHQNALVQTAESLPGVYYSEAEMVLTQLLHDNLQHDSDFNYKRSAECLHFLQFSGPMLLAFPAGLYMRSRIRKNKRLNYILQFKELLQVRNNIEKGSFAYDTLLFKQSAFQLLKNKSHLANLVCLAILFGDEFIDGIAAAYSKQNIRRLLNDEAADYYLHYKKTGDSYELYYAFDICDVLPKKVLETVNVKYDISYRAFYGHLQFLLGEMNLFLSKLSGEKAAEAAYLVCKACNKCFDTYKTDINGFDEHFTLGDLLQYQKTKDDDIIQVLLTLRAVLLNRKQLQYQKQFSSWSSMVRSMQLYDDMQDVAADCNFQMNTVCYFAKNYFNEEWQWLLQHKEHLQNCRGMELHSSISLHMPASCIITMQYARNIAHSKLNWVQRKVQNYLWRKNWLGFNNPLLNEKGFCLSALMNKRHSSIPLKFHFIKKLVMQAGNVLITDDMKWAHIIDVALMDDELKNFIFKKINKRERYCLTSCFLEYPVQQKALLAKRMLSVQ